MLALKMKGCHMKSNVSSFEELKGSPWLMTSKEMRNSVMRKTKERRKFVMTTSD